MGTRHAFLQGRRGGGVSSEFQCGVYFSSFTTTSDGDLEQRPRKGHYLS
jgi:hypothetical protein